MQGALKALRVLTRKYEFKSDEKRAVLEEIVNATLPQLLAIFKASCTALCWLLCPHLALAGWLCSAGQLCA